MKAIIDILLLIIIALCTWSGYKRGLVGGVASLLAIVIALLGGSIVAAAYSHEVVPAFEPFVDGYVDLPKCPGLGVCVNKELVVEENKTPHNWKNPVWRHTDGSVAEW